MSTYFILKNELDRKRKVVPKVLVDLLIILFPSESWPFVCLLL